jgi:molybdopterin converting factor small subunit
MQITVRFSGPLRALAGQQRLTLSLGEGDTLVDLLGELRKVLPMPFAEQILTSLGTGKGPIPLVLINGVHPRGPNDLDRPLADGDVVAFVPPMAGG